MRLFFGSHLFYTTVWVNVKWGKKSTQGKHDLVYSDTYIFMPHTYRNCCITENTDQKNLERAYNVCVGIHTVGGEVVDVGARGNTVVLFKHFVFIRFRGFSGHRHYMNRRKVKTSGVHQQMNSNERKIFKVLILGKTVCFFYANIKSYAMQNIDIHH